MHLSSDASHDRTIINFKIDLHNCLLQPWDLVEPHRSHSNDEQTLACYNEDVEGLLIDQSSDFIDVNLNALTLQVLA